MKNTIFYLFVSLSALFVADVFKAQARDRTFKVGVLLCLTGECAEWGNASLKGLQLAAKEINKSGGILGRDIELVVDDSREGQGSSAAHSVSAFRRLLLSNEIKYFVGPTWTPAGLAIAPIASKEQGIIMTSPSLGVADFNEAGANLFNTWPHDENATKYLAQWAYKNNLKKIAIMSSQQPWESAQGRIFREEFAKLDGVVSLLLEPLPEQRDLSIEATKITHSNSDAVVFTDLGRMDLIAKELDKKGFSGKKLSVLMDKSRLENAKEALKGTAYVTHQPATELFVSSFKDEFREEPGISADTAYDALQVYASAINSAGTDNTSVVQKTLQSLTLSGASGKFQFDAQGGVVRDPVIREVP